MSTPRYPVSYSEARRLQQQGVLCECDDPRCRYHPGKACRRIIHLKAERTSVTLHGARLTFCEECADNAVERGKIESTD